MITYIYWIFVLALTGGTLYLLGIKLKQWIPAAVVSGVILVVCASFYYFYLQQMFVKRWGGTMSLSVPEGMQHVAATWKDDNMWIENYDPKTNTCYFQEYSRGAMLEGKVVIKNCNPVPR
ncbi:MULTISPECIES: hypothetical protein [unclassified Hahella]|uniref:hypothetical protein n=1 Tax=unclassified Hahella TaxID=2624107 RepID=UPI000FDCDE15|nr:MULTISPECIES: hypothetical protein [unclassified Hahella]AZZ91864.1 hypothetical protein ENC22_11880 [Hahella sp. KA22]MBU6953294.1 hypothetical protein [Hahella sp. HN01]MDG9670925.1 hypothetical protein [Hahella sp. CR1]QAY55235.1 hypothetical protein EUZ85_14445 [Hahella sp. KA22]